MKSTTIQETTRSSSLFPAQLLSARSTCTSEDEDQRSPQIGASKEPMEDESCLDYLVVTCQRGRWVASCHASIICALVLRISRIGIRGCQTEQNSAFRADKGARTVHNHKMLSRAMPPLHENKHFSPSASCCMAWSCGAALSPKSRRYKPFVRLWLVEEERAPTTSHELHYAKAANSWLIRSSSLL
jgi:hypothetical protein